MELTHSLSGMLCARVTSADPAGALTAIQQADIQVFDAQCADEDIDLYFYIRRQDCKSLHKLCTGKGYDLKILRSAGAYWALRRILDRPLLLVGMLILLVLSAYLPTRVLFVRVDGATNVPVRLILEKSDACGISFGASRELVRSEKVKNALLAAIPELQWAGINTSGCVATVSVRERSDAVSNDKSYGVGSVVAIRDGVITQAVATRGTLQCKPGDAVKAGQVLISGYTDCGISIQATTAQGEIFAQTEHNITAVSPSIRLEKAKIRVESKKYALILGKKRINFYKGSGISGTGCDKIYLEQTVTLPGGFMLPISLVTEVWYSYVPVEALCGSNTLADCAVYYLKDQMTAGTILRREESFQEAETLLILQGKYACTEMIGRLQNEEIIKPDGEYD